MINLLSKIDESNWFYSSNEELCKPFIGKPYISYSTSESYLNYTEDFIKEKLVGIPPPKKIYAEFGSYVGYALEHGKFPDENPFGFEGQENFDFSSRVVDAEYEKMIIIDRGDYCIIGFIDEFHNGLVKDQKTGGKDKEKDYSSKEYTQTVLYCYGVELQGEEVKGTSVKFIRRVGSHVNPPLAISKEQFEIPLEYNEERLKYALSKIDKSVKGISSIKTTYDKFFKYTD